VSRPHSDNDPREGRSRNVRGYAGEVISISAVLERIQEEAVPAGWQVEEFGRAARWPLMALHRTGSPTGPAVYVSSGIHGDEPAGPLAALELIRQSEWGRGCHIWLCPCLNPGGFHANRRENPAGCDLNRDYRHRASMEVRSHVDWLTRCPKFDFTISMHEDWESDGFYLYELNPDGRLSAAAGVVADVASVCAIDRSAMIDGRPAVGGIIRPELDPDLRPEWPEAFYLLQKQTRLSYTLEAPSALELSIRVRALTVAAGSITRQLAG